MADGKASSDKKSLLLGVGYTWSTWRMDTELLLGQSLTYSQNPLFDNGLGVLDSKITSNSLIATFYYDFRELFLFKPFVGFSLGAGINKTSGTIDGVALKSSSDFAPAFGIQFGANARILNSNAFIGASYKYLYLGKATFANTDNPISTLKLQGNLISSGFGLNINYLF